MTFRLTKTLFNWVLRINFETNVIFTLFEYLQFLKCAFVNLFDINKNRNHYILIIYN